MGGRSLPLWICTVSFDFRRLGKFGCKREPVLQTLYSLWNIAGVKYLISECNTTSAAEKCVHADHTPTAGATCLFVKWGDQSLDAGCVTMYRPNAKMERITQISSGRGDRNTKITDPQQKYIRFGAYTVSFTVAWTLWLSQNGCSILWMTLLTIGCQLKSFSTQSTATNKCSRRVHTRMCFYHRWSIVFAAWVNVSFQSLVSIVWLFVLPFYVHSACDTL